jgi:hypothetical protein
LRLVILLGEDPAQILGAIYTFRNKIEEIVLLADATAEEQRRAMRFRNALTGFAKRERLPWRMTVKTIRDTDEESLTSLYETITADGPAALLAADAPVAPLLLLAPRFMHEGAVIAYDAYDNRLSLIERNRTEHFEADRMDIETYCAMLGYVLESELPEKRFRHDRENVLAVFADESRFIQVRRALLNPKRHGDFDFDAFDDVIKPLERMGLVKNRRLVDEAAKRRLQGQLFEEYIYWLCKEEGFDDIRLGCVIDFMPGERENSKRVTNEFDILFIEGNRIGTIECKYVYRLDGQRYLMHYDAVTDYFGRTARALIVNVYQREKPRPADANFRPGLLRRARLGNVRIYSDIHFDPIRFKNHLRWTQPDG